MNATSLVQPAPHRLADVAPPRVEIVVPVFNEERVLAESVRRLSAYLEREMPVNWGIVIADNASTDATPFIAAELARRLDGVRLLRLEEKGRGRALRAAWLASKAEVVAYMDVDLSTDLRALAPLTAPLLSGHSDVSVGTRLGHGARVTRGPRRELISRAYNRLLRGALAARFSDAQCGFKAVRAQVARKLVPEVRDEGWFFDTELLILAQRQGLRIHEVPVDWVDDPDSRVDVVSTALDDIKGILRLLGEARLIRFAAIGVCSTLAFAALFLSLRGALGAAGANAVSLALTAVANTQANRRFTFGVRGREDLVRHHVSGAAVFFLTLGLTSGVLAVLHRIDPDPQRLLELAVLLMASVSATVTRYVALRSWVFARRRPGPLRQAVAAMGRTVL